MCATRSRQGGALPPRGGGGAAGARCGARNAARAFPAAATGMCDGERTEGACRALPRQSFRSPGLSHLANPSSAPPPQESALIADLLAAAEQPQLHWRYRCLTESALCMLLPLLDAASGAALARHWAGEHITHGEARARPTVACLPHPRASHGLPCPPRLSPPACCRPTRRRRPSSLSPLVPRTPALPCRQPCCRRTCCSCAR